MFLIAGQTALASSPWNGMSNDCPTVAIANFTTNTGFVDPCWPLTNVSANPGETVNVRVYYHNSSATSATNTSITLSTSGTGPANSYSFSGVLKSAQGDLSFGPVTVSANGASGLTFGSAKWYPNHSFTEASFPSGQSGNEIMSGGVNLGTVAPGWATQGSVVISFQVGGASASNCTINSFTPSSQTVAANSTATLSWSTSNCNSVFISGIGNQTANGSATVSPSSTTTYTLTASGTGIAPSPRTAVVNVSANNNNNNAPTATTNSPSSVGTDRATLSGYVNGNGSLINGWLEFPCNGAQYGNVYSVSSSSLSTVIYSLNPNSTYSYCAVAQNIASGATVRGNQITFNTDTDGNFNNDSFPTVSTYAATNVSEDSATLNGRVDGNGTTTTRWFRYGTASGYMNMTTSRISNGSGSRSISDSVSNLNPNTTYYYQAVAQNSYGTIYGSTFSFTTDTSWVNNSNQISVITTIATNVQQTSASINGLLMNTGNSSTNVYFEYGSTPNFGQTTNRKYLNAGTSIPFSEYISNLSPGTLYYYRAVGENNNGTIRGSMEIFRTPSVITNNTNTNTTTTRTVYVNTGVTRVGMESPIMLKIENRYELFNIGDSVDYTVTYKNIGSVKLVKPLLQVILPQHVTFMNASRGTYAPENMTLSVPLEDLLPQGEGVVYVQARVTSLPNNNSNIVSTALLVYTSPSSAQENAIAYVLNHENGYNNVNLGASAGFLNFWGLGIFGWLLLLILILLIILIARTYRRRYDDTYYAPYVARGPVSNHTDNQGFHNSTPHT